MSKLHESLRQIFSVLDNFLNITLRNENLGKAAEKERFKISALLKKLYSEHEDINPNPPSSKRKSQFRDSKVDSASSLTTSRSSSILSDFDKPIYDTPKEFAPTTVKALTKPFRIGFLQMKSQGAKQKPYCVLHKNTLYWFSKPFDKQQEGAISIKDYEFRSDEKKIAKKNFTFELVGPGKKPFQFVADSKEDLESWKKAFDDAHECNDEIIEEFNKNDDGLTYFNDDPYDKPSRDLPPTPKESEGHYANEPAYTPSETWHDDTPTYVNLNEDETENIYEYLENQD